MESMGERVKRLRQERGWTQGEAAEGICAASMWSMIESGRAKPSARTMARVAERLGVSVRTLLGEGGEAGAKLHFQAAQALAELGDGHGAAEVVQAMTDGERAEVGEWAVLMLEARCAQLCRQAETALERLEDAYEHAAVFGERGRMAETARRMGEVEEQRGRLQAAEWQYERAWRVLERAGRGSRGMGDPALERRVCLALGRVAMELGRGEASREWAERALRGGTEAGGPQAGTSLETERLCREAQALLLQGEARRAADVLQAAESRRADWVRRRELCEGKRLYAQSLLCGGAYEEAWRWYEAARLELRWLGDLPALGRLHGEMAVCLLLSGRSGEAAEWWGQLADDLLPGWSAGAAVRLSSTADGTRLS